jgi:hypothetical protein
MKGELHSTANITKWRVSMNRIINFRVPQKQEISWRAEYQLFKNRPKPEVREVLTVKMLKLRIAD